MFSLTTHKHTKWGSSAETEGPDIRTNWDPLCLFCEFCSNPCMVHYRCDDCGMFFDEPTVTHYSESLNGQIRRYSEEQCPACGCNSFSEVNACPGCQKTKLTTDQFCYPCRKALKTRVIDFFDKLTLRSKVRSLKQF